MMRRASSRTTRRIATITVVTLLTCSLAPSPSLAAPVPAHVQSREEGRRLAEDGHDDAALEHWRRAYGQVPPGPEGDADRAALMLEIGRAEHRLHRANNEPTYLRRAAAALRFCVEHEASLPETEREAVATELAEVERTLAQIDGPATGPSPALDPATAATPTPVAVQPAPAGTPAPASNPAPPPALPPDPGRERARKTASGVGIAGAVFAGAGGVAWLLLALPAELSAQVAEDRAADNPLLVSESELQRRADNRRAFARTAFWVGLGLVGAGGIMLGVGFGTKAKIERDMQRSKARVSFAPFISPHEAAGTLTLRF